MTIKDEKYFDEIMFNDALCCSSIVASITILQLAFDRFRFIKNSQNDKIRFIVTYSENDRVIPFFNTKKLIEDTKPLLSKEFKNIGHTVVLEARDEYYEMVRNIICREA